MTPFADAVLDSPSPRSIADDVRLPRRVRYHPSPVDWRHEVLYFLLVDRFSDGAEATRPLLDRSRRERARPDGVDGQAWRWDLWARSGAERFQGGTLRGVQSKLDYVQGLGVTALWLSPVFRQRGHLDTFHGYGFQNLLEVDPRFGTREELVALVEAAHARGMRVILDVIFNHSGSNWLYPGNVVGPPYVPPPSRYGFGAWLDREGAPMAGPIEDLEAGVWPRELQDPDCYTRAGVGDLAAGALDDPDAEHKRTDFVALRDFALSPRVLKHLADCYKYWVALTDCDGFRIDTLKHVSLEQARNFCGELKEFAANIGKDRFLLVGEVAGGDFAQDRYLDVLGRNLDAALDIGEMRLVLRSTAKGLMDPRVYFSGFDEGCAEMGSHRAIGERHVSVLDDHDHVFGEKLRFASEAVTEEQLVAGVAMQLFTLGIPCLYYGTEQSLAGPEESARRFLPGWGGGESADRYLREAMFGPRHPRRSGLGGLTETGSLDLSSPGFGPFGTAGAHCFDPSFHVYRRIAALGAARRAFPVLRVGRQYLRPVSLFGGPFEHRGAGELIAWSRILADEEALIIVNGHGLSPRGGDVIVDADLSPPGSDLTVVTNSAEDGGAGAVGHPRGSRVRVRAARDGAAFVEIRAVPPSGVLVLVNH